MYAGDEPAYTTLMAAKLATLVPVSGEMLVDALDPGVLGVFLRDRLVVAVTRSLHFLLFGEEWGTPREETERLELGARAARWRDRTSWEDDDDCCA